MSSVNLQDHSPSFVTSVTQTNPHRATLRTCEIDNGYASCSCVVRRFPEWENTNGPCVFFCVPMWVVRGRHARRFYHHVCHLNFFRGVRHVRNFTSTCVPFRSPRG